MSPNIAYHFWRRHFTFLFYFCQKSVAFSERIIIWALNLLISISKSSLNSFWIVLWPKQLQILSLTLITFYSVFCSSLINNAQYECIRNLLRRWRTFNKIPEGRLRFKNLCLKEFLHLVETVFVFSRMCHLCTT